MKRILSTCLGLLLIALLSACAKHQDIGSHENSSEPFEKPYRIELSLYQGHLHGMSFHYIAGNESLKYAKFEQIIRFVWNETLGKYVPEDNKKRNHFVVRKGVHRQSPVYGLWIDYYDKKGNKLNGEIGKRKTIDNFQHFFVAESVEDIFQDEKELKTHTATDDPETDKLMTYYYRDTNPWDGTRHSNAEQIGVSNPLGLKGYFHFGQVRKKFDLKIQLWHTPNGSKTAQGISPFSAPNELVRSKGKVILELSVPVVIFISSNEILPVEDEARENPLESFSQKEQAVIRSFQRAYAPVWGEKIPLQEALNDLNWLGEPASHHSGGRWL